MALALQVGVDDRCGVGIVHDDGFDGGIHDANLVVVGGPRVEQECAEYLAESDDERGIRIIRRVHSIGIVDVHVTSFRRAIHLRSHANHKSSTHHPSTRLVKGLQTLYIPSSTTELDRPYLVELHGRGEGKGKGPHRREVPILRTTCCPSRRPCVPRRPRSRGSPTPCSSPLPCACGSCAARHATASRSSCRVPWQGLRVASSCPSASPRPASSQEPCASGQPSWERPLQASPGAVRRLLPCCHLPSYVSVFDFRPHHTLPEHHVQPPTRTFNLTL